MRADGGDRDSTHHHDPRGPGRRLQRSFSEQRGEIDGVAREQLRGEGLDHALGSCGELRFALGIVSQSAQELCDAVLCSRAIDGHQFQERSSASGRSGRRAE